MSEQPTQPENDTTPPQDILSELENLTKKVAELETKVDSMAGSILSRQDVSAIVLPAIKQAVDTLQSDYMSLSTTVASNTQKIDNIMDLFKQQQLLQSNIDHTISTLQSILVGENTVDKPGLYAEVTIMKREIAALPEMKEEMHDFITETRFKNKQNLEKELLKAQIQATRERRIRTMRTISKGIAKTILTRIIPLGGLLGFISSEVLRILSDGVK